MTEKKNYEQTVDDFLAKIEGDLRKLDDALDAQGEKFKKDVKGFEEKIKEFMDENDEELSELRDKAGHELDRLKKELDHTGKALRDSFHYFKAQYKNRKKED